MTSDDGTSVAPAITQPPVDSLSELPARLRLLCVSADEPSWINLTLQLDAERCHEPQFQWVATSAEAIALLRDESFDCVLVGDDPARQPASDPTAVYAFLRAMRASGCDDPIVLLAARLHDRHWPEAYLNECELLVTPKPWESPALVAVIKRAIHRVELVRDNRRLALANHRRLVRERDEAEHLLQQQREMIRDLRLSWVPAGGSQRAEGLLDADEERSFGACSSRLPNEIDDYYHELLRTYVIMGSGSLAQEIAKLSELLCVAGLSPREALHLHLERVESLVRGLGNRSTRHVMARADLLALELIIHLGECYRQRHLQHATSDETASAG